MTMSLTKSGPRVRLVAPLPLKVGKTTVRTLGAAPGGGLLTLKAVAAPGSSCSISAQGKGKPVVLQAAKRTTTGQIATTITTSTVKSKLKAKKNDRVTISMACTLGKKRFSTSAQVVLG